MTIIRRLVFGVILLALFVSPLPAAAGAFSAAYVIGDSLSDQANLLAATGVAPDPAHYFQGRFSNGPVYADLLAQALGLPLSRSSAGGNNFAYGGARTNYNSAEMQAGGPFPNGFRPWTLTAEVAAFQARNVQDPNGLYIVFSGANDVADIVAGNLPNPTAVITNAVGGILSAVQAFKAAGAGTIVVPNLPDLGFLPFFLNDPDPLKSQKAHDLTVEFNLGLKTALDAVAGPRIIQFQTDDLFLDVVTNPLKYGFDPNVIDLPCYTGFVSPQMPGIECATPRDYVFWDRVHPTAAIHRILANEILESIPQPSTLWLGAACLLVLAWSRRAAARPAARLVPLRVS